MSLRYEAYAKARGAASADEMRERDRVEWPGGPMAGFMIWIADQWHVWEYENGAGSHSAPRSIADHDNFDRWLLSRISRPPVEKE